MSTFVEITRRVHPDYEPQVLDRITHALVVAGRPTWANLTDEMNAQVGADDYTHWGVINLFGRRTNRRARLDVDALEDLVATLAERYGLCYQRKDGTPGRPIDRAWFEADRMEPLMQHIPGYPNSLRCGLLAEEVAA